MLGGDGGGGENEYKEGTGRRSAVRYKLGALTKGSYCLKSGTFHFLKIAVLSRELNIILVSLVDLPRRKGMACVED